MKRLNSVCQSTISVIVLLLFKRDATEEFCEDEFVRKNCSSGEVVFFDGALLGRHDVSRCHNLSLDEQNCSADVRRPLQSYVGRTNSVSIEMSGTFVHGLLPNCSRRGRPHSLIALLKCQKVNPSERCIGEEFTASCQKPRKIRIKSAIFGRMSRSACVDFDVIDLGCSADVREDLRRECDRREECRIRNIEDYFLNASTDCPKGLKQYLDAVYDCDDDDDDDDDDAEGKESNASPFHSRILYALLGPVVVIFVSMVALVWLLLRFRSRRTRIEESENETECVGDSIIASNLRQSDNNVIVRNDFYSASYTDSYEEHNEQKLSVEDDVYDEIRDTGP